MTDAVPHDPQPLRADEVIDLGHLTVTSQRDRAVHRIRLVGELDLATTDGAENALMRAEASDAASIVVDLSALTFIDSTGLRLLYSAAKRSRDSSDRLVLLRGGPAVQRALQLSGLEDQMPFAD